MLADAYPALRARELRELGGAMAAAMHKPEALEEIGADGPAAHEARTSGDFQKHWWEEG